MVQNINKNTTALVNKPFALVSQIEKYKMFRDEHLEFAIKLARCGSKSKSKQSSCGYWNSTGLFLLINLQKFK